MTTSRSPIRGPRAPPFRSSGQAWAASAKRSSASCWNLRWIPLTYDGAGSHHCLDLDPSADGSVGQLIEIWHDTPERRLVSLGLVAWLEHIAASIAEATYEDYAEDDQDIDGDEEGDENR